MPARTGRGFPSRPTNWSVPPPPAVAAGQGYTGFGQTIQRSLNPSDYTATGTVTAVIEVHGKTSNAAVPLLVRLKNVTLASVIGGSGISSAATSMTRARSGSFSLTPGANTYQVEYGGTIGTTFSMYDVVVILTVTP